MVEILLQMLLAQIFFVNVRNAFVVFQMCSYETQYDTLFIVNKPH